MKIFQAKHESKPPNENLWRPAEPGLRQPPPAKSSAIDIRARSMRLKGSNTTGKTRIVVSKSKNIIHTKGVFDEEAVHDVLEAEICSRHASQKWAQILLICIGL